jgi:hypothetical protein
MASLTLFASVSFSTRWAFSASVSSADGGGGQMLPVCVGRPIVRLELAIIMVDNVVEQTSLVPQLISGFVVFDSWNYIEM